MLDFVNIREVEEKSCVKIVPDFIVGKRHQDLMIRGGRFYAVWDEEAGLWDTDERTVAVLVDKEIKRVYDEVKKYRKKMKSTIDVKPMYMRDFSTNHWSQWQKFSKSLSDSYHELDKRIIFSNYQVTKEDYCTRVLDYPIVKGPCEAYNELMSTLYTQPERDKLEWAIGAIISGQSAKVQKFIVLFGAPGTGKSTFLDIVQRMFPGYYTNFEASELTSRNASFAMESFRLNPLIAIQHDGDLSRIEDNTRLNSIISNEEMVVNEKYKQAYNMKITSFLFMGTNKPVRITDAKSGLLRRLIDVNPSGNKIPIRRYHELIKKVKFEMSGIAYHCLKKFEEMGPQYYKDYTASSMLGKTNDMYGFLLDNYDFLADDSDGIDMRTVWLRYKNYCEDARVPYPMSMRQFRNELDDYFRERKERYANRYNVYFGFRKDKFQVESEDAVAMPEPESNDAVIPSWLRMDSNTPSEFDDIFRKCPAQYATPDGKPLLPWDSVTTTLSELNTREIHYVLPPSNLITIDFDLKNEKGEKDYGLNLEAASKFPATYAETSKSGRGIHLHYYYDGDIERLERLYSKDVEIKIYKGKSSLRRLLTKCNAFAIATISSGLPLKEVQKNVTTSKTISSEKGLRSMIVRNLRKEIHPATKPSIDFIYTILEEAYNRGMHYDVTDMRNDIQQFALNSTNQSDYCLRLVGRMKFKSEEPSVGREGTEKDDGPIIFFDVEVFPNLFVLVWKKQGSDAQYVKLINPSPSEVEELTKYRLVGFNNRLYDNHIVYARIMGYTNEQLYQLSQSIIKSKTRDMLFGEAYNLSYTDIYDFLSAQNKMSLKKWEIKLGIHHKELGLPWDEPVPEEKWQEVADYCTNDVFATEAVWDANQGDWDARQILAEWAGMTVNDTTNSLTTKIIIGNDRDPWSKYIYTDLSTIFPGYEYNEFGIDRSRYNEGAKIVNGKAIYKGEDPGDGGRVFAKPGIWTNVALLDVESMHPHSIVKLKIFGEEYTMRFSDIMEARLMIKHGMYEEAKKHLPPEVHKYLANKRKAKSLATALKTAINSVYGLTSAKFKHKLRDPRNKDNIVAKYGALFMIDLQEEVEKRGYTVVHIKTDSIKIADADDYIINFCMDFAKDYGFTFEHEDTYSKMCLVNDAVYVARYAEAHIDDDGKEHWWTATGTQFKVPYVFKSLFSHEDIIFDDVCETKNSDKGPIYLDFNEGMPDVSVEEKEFEKLEKRYKKGELSDVIFEQECSRLNEVIATGHNYHFVGKVGAFCPVKDGVGGGYMVRSMNNKMYAVNNTKRKKGGGVHRWIESEYAKNLDMSDIDTSYYENLVDEAIEAIAKHGDVEWFISDDVGKPSIPMNPPIAA